MTNGDRIRQMSNKALANVVKMENTTEKIEELWGYMKFRSDYDRDKVIIDKLNEVIRRINNAR